MVKLTAMLGFLGQKNGTDPALASSLKVVDEERHCVCSDYLYQKHYDLLRHDHDGHLQTTLIAEPRGNRLAREICFDNIDLKVRVFSL
ncbi:hypothetical protein MMC31_000044 [Peltigera leucophlebia]|nr:hypothetical protein [Peltigera leucophlebia]